MIIRYHNIEDDKAITTMDNLFNVEMKMEYLHDDGFKLLTMSLLYDIDRMIYNHN
jgi:hypothetical protein